MPYWRLSGFYLFYFAVLGTLVPYWALYLHSLGYTAVDIGHLMALLMISRIVAPNIWAWIADHRESRMRMVRLTTLLTIVTFAGVFFGTSFWWLGLVMLVFSFFWNASLPLLEVTTMRHLGGSAGAYGRVRLWGSIGFIVSVAALGPVIDAYGPWWVLPSLLIFMGGIWVFSLVLPESEVRGPAEHPSPFLKTIMRPEVALFLFACFLMQASHGPYYTFYSIYLVDHGYSKTLIGLLWAFAVLCEIGVFLLMQKLMTHIPLRRILMASFALATVRWLLIGQFPDSLTMLVLAQTLHAATFGTFHAAGMQVVYRFFTGHHQFRGQAIYSSVSFGGGGAVGSLYSGYMWASAGPTLTFAVAALLSLGAFLIAWRLLREHV
ncbi:MAG: MFS transporter [Gammaproteobacteria bacterium]|nr:MFS transporter [Gammaproteobacteria bacterium]